MVVRSAVLLTLAALLVGCGEASLEETSELPEHGRFRRLQRSAVGDDANTERVARLRSIGYVSGSVQAPEFRGVTIHRADEAFPGLNFYASGHAPEAILMDMTGRELHRWHYEFHDVWPTAELRTEEDREMTRFWRRAHLYENGDVLAIFEGLGLIKLDKDSTLIWASPRRAHHDMAVLDNGDILVLTRKLHVFAEERKILIEDFLVTLNEDGQLKSRFSLLDAFEKSAFRETWRKNLDRDGHDPDIFHTNSLTVLDGRGADKLPALRSGNVLVSMRTVHVIAVVDLETEEVVWAATGNYKYQHDPTVLDNGNLLLFDNEGRPGQSSVQEIDPVDGRIVWEYRAGEEFYSETCGTAQRLPNGNTLVTESDNGRAFELTSDKRLVWEFYNPHRAGDDDEFIATLFEVVRLHLDFPTGWLTTGDAAQ